MIDQQDLKRIRRALEDKESPRVYGEDRGGRMITLLVLKVVDFGDSSQLLLRETRTGRYRTMDVEKGKWNSATLIQDSLFTKKRAKAGKARWKGKRKMKQSEILMVRKAISDTAKTKYAKKANSDEWMGLLPLTPFLKKAVSREEVDSGFWLVHDSEQGCWYVIDKPTGLMVTRAETSSKAKKNFNLLRDKAFKARIGKGYEEAKKRLLRLQDRPVWDPKEESEEEFAKRLAGWEKSYMEEEK